MNKSAILHLPKSYMAFAISKDTIEIKLKTAKNDFERVEIIIGDPFDYKKFFEGKDATYLWAPRTEPFIKMEKKYITLDDDYYESRVHIKTYRAKYAFLLYTKDDVYIYNASGIKHLGSKNSFIINNQIEKGANYNTTNDIFTITDYFNFPYINEEDIYNTPEWTKNTIWYQIFPDRFHKDFDQEGDFLEFGSVVEGINNKMLFGGSIKGVIEKIPYLKNLGITGIYFTPIFLSPSAHKYDTTNYLLIDPQFGTNADFKELVDELHNNGIRIILDAVFNHCGWNHPYFQDAIKKGKASKYYDCFYFDDTEFTNYEIKKGKPVINHWDFRANYRSFAFTPFMPKLNTSNPIMRKYLLKVTRYWTENYNIDGWRLDVSNEVSHDFWREFRKLVKSINKDAYILGENWDDSNPWLQGDQMDGVMNYSLSVPIWRFFGTDKHDLHISAEEFKEAITKLLIKYPSSVAQGMFNLVDSHDTPRILHRCGENKNLAKMCYLFMLTFPGSPNIYYGDEIGLTGGNDPDNRRCMIWDDECQDLDTFFWMKEVISYRKFYPQFRSENFIWHHAKNGVLVYQKENMYFFFNTTDKPVKILLPNEIAQKTVYCVDCNNDKHLKEDIVIGAYHYMILEN